MLPSDISDTKVPSWVTSDVLLWAEMSTLESWHIRCHVGNTALRDLLANSQIKSRKLVHASEVNFSSRENAWICNHASFKNHSMSFANKAILPFYLKIHGSRLVIRQQTLTPASSTMATHLSGVRSRPNQQSPIWTCLNLLWSMHPLPRQGGNSQVNKLRRLSAILQWPQCVSNEVTVVLQ